MSRIDYTTLLDGGSKDTAQGAINKKWWLLKGEERAQAVSKILIFLAQYDSARQTQYQLSNRLYGNCDLMGINGLSLTKAASFKEAIKDRITYNVVQSTIDTVTSKMSKNKPKPMFLTSGGDYKIQRRAKKLDKFCEGVFYENDAFSLGVDVFRDACIFGDGCVHVFEKYGRVKFDRVLTSELYIDQNEAVNGGPRQLHRVKDVDRDVLLDLFPEKVALIEQANEASTELSESYQNVSDQIRVIESWHLPSGPNAKDGVHTIVIEKGELFSEPWEHDGFPFAFLSWSKKTQGFFSQGLAEQLQSIQLEINKLLFIIQRSMRLAGSFKVLIENGSKIVKEHLNNEVGAVITYNNTPPQYVVPPAVPLEYYSHLQTLKNLAYEQAGVSQLSASSQKPAGLNSGAALREYNDIESDRFQVIGHAYENFFLALARLSIQTAKAIYARDKSYKVRVHNDRFVETIDWKEINLKDDEYVMKIFPVSSLPDTPSGRLQTVQEFAQAGFITPRTATRLLDFPDLKQVETLANAQEDWIHQVLEKIVEDGDYTPPEPMMDLALAKELVLQYYAQGEVQGLEQDKLNQLIEFSEQVDALLQKGQGAAQPGAQPQAAPQPPPQSDLIQNTPTQPQGAA